MVARSKKKLTTIKLSTWGIRGTAALVEEWESRRSIPEENQRPRRRSEVSDGKVSQSASHHEDPKK